MPYFVGFCLKKHNNKKLQLQLNKELVYVCLGTLKAGWIFQHRRLKVCIFGTKTFFLSHLQDQPINPDNEEPEDPSQRPELHEAALKPSLICMCSLAWHACNKQTTHAFSTEVT